MNVTLWILQGFLAAVFLASGVMNLTQPKDKLAPKMGWVEPVPSSAIKTLGALEVAATIGLIFPAAFDIAPILVVWSAIGLIIVMIGAAIIHWRRNEPQIIIVNAVLLILAAVVVWGRLGSYSF